MILYTVIPLDDVFEGIEEPPITTTEMAVGGMTLELEPLDDFRAKVVRIISSDPRHYLAPHYQPGAVIRWDIV